MRGINKAIIVGTLGADPEVRYTASGAAVANVNIATNDEWKDKKTGDKQERTEWHRVVFFGRLAEIVGEYLAKGRQVYVEGRLQTRKWQDNNGNDRYTTEIVANEMQMLGGKHDLPGGTRFDAPPSQSAPPSNDGDKVSAPAQDNGFSDDDIPF